MTAVGVGYDEVDQASSADRPQRGEHCHLNVVDVPQTQSQPRSQSPSRPQQQPAPLSHPQFGLVHHPYADLVDDLAAITAQMRVLEGQLVAAVGRLQTVCEQPDGSVQENLAHAYGYRNATTLVEGVTGISSSAVRDLIRLARHTSDRLTLTGQVLEPDLPHLRTALDAGQIGVDCATAIVRPLAPLLPRVDPADLHLADRSLVEMATGMISTGPGAGIRHSASLIADAARLWCDRIDPDGIEPRAQQAHQHRSLTVSKRAYKGLHTVRGRIPTDIAMRFHTQCDTMMRQERLTSHNTDETATNSTGTDTSDTDAPSTDTSDTSHGTALSADNNTVGASNTADIADDTILLAEDYRTREQSGADLFAAMLTAITTTRDFTTPPAVLVTIATNSDHGTGTGTGNNTGGCRIGSDQSFARTGLINGQPAPRSMITQIMCDSGTQIVGQDPTGRVLSLSTTARVFTPNQRRAIAARDGHTCLIPHCRIPATACEAHHVLPWSENGKTHVDNGVLLCWQHHRMIDQHYWAVTMIDGVPHITSPVSRKDRGPTQTVPFHRRT